jgi:hypothetical protein
LCIAMGPENIHRRAGWLRDFVFCRGFRRALPAGSHMVARGIAV